MKKIIVYNLSELNTAKLNEFNELQEDFKVYDTEKNLKLQNLIITRGFKYSFKAWKDNDDKLWIIDAHQRKSALIELQKKGYKIPELPYELIYAKNKKEAVEEIAAYNSEFAEKNPDTKLFEKYNIGTEIMEQFNLEFKTIDLGIEKDDIDWDELGKNPNSKNAAQNYAVKYEIIFNNEGEQDKWYKFLAELKSKYPEIETISERLLQYIADHE